MTKTTIINSPFLILKKKINLKFLSLSNTKYHLIAGNYASTVLLRAKKVVKNGKNYLQFDKMKIKIAIGDATINLSNLFGDEVISEYILKFFCHIKCEIRKMQELYTHVHVVKS